MGATSAGLHRLEAAKALDWDEIDAVFMGADDAHRTLAEIDENLCRAELTPAQAAYHTAKRKEVYEALYPETKRGVAGGKARQGSASDNLSFAEQTAETTGRDKRTIHRDAARGEALGDALKDISGTPLDKGVELDALAKLDPEQRAEVIDKVRRGEINATASEANASHGRRMFPSGSFHHPFASALR